MSLNRVKLGHASYFYEIACYHGFFKLCTENFNLK